MFFYPLTLLKVERLKPVGDDVRSYFPKGVWGNAPCEIIFEKTDMAESDNILMKLQDLLVYLIPQLNKFPCDQKFVLGDRIETKLLDVQEDCLRAYYSRDKRGHLLEANL